MPDDTRVLARLLIPLSVVLLLLGCGSKSADKDAAVAPLPCPGDCEARSACQVGQCLEGQCRFESKAPGTDCPDQIQSPCFDAQCTETGQCFAEARLRPLVKVECVEGMPCCTPERWAADMELLVRRVLTRWQQSQEARELDRFAELYAEDFEGTSNRDKAAWITMRQGRFARRQMVEVHSIVVSPRGGESAEVVFVEDWAWKDVVEQSRVEMTIGLDGLIHREDRKRTLRLPKACAFRNCKASESVERLVSCKAGCEAGSVLECFATSRLLAKRQCGQNADLAESARLTKKVCEAGGLRGCAEGVESFEESDPAWARREYQRACQWNQPYACEQYARVLQEGVGGPKDVAAAAAVLERLCQHTCVWPNTEMACLRVAGLYERGEGVVADPDKAARYLADSEELCDH